MLNFGSNINQELRQGRIIVVDEDETVSSMVRAHFNADGFQVDSVTDAAQLFSTDLSVYDLMIIDTEIDGNNGLNIVEQVKQHRDTSRMGVITSSVNMSPASIIDALNAGADDYLLKPFSLRELLARAHSVLRRLPDRRDDSRRIS
ncbi:MAG: response regulator transcription factor [Muribaculaceae bacterium]|nr:response regulator transcription factor [Muribaculaceae bacterium]